jgi:hypothetical protein
MSRSTSSLLALSTLLVAKLALAQAPGPISAETVLANNDTDKDGVVTKEEATKVGRMLGQQWDRFDANKDGKVDLEEIKKGLAAMPAGGPGGAPPAGGPPAAK